MLRLNLERYQDGSYFHDNRFLRAFENLAGWLQANNLLRITTVLVDGKVAAVDMGAVWNSTYTVMAGGTDAGFPGIAKLINLHHLEWACAQKVRMVDFLCGEFNWKARFHLQARPLYAIEKSRSVQNWMEPALYHRREACAA
jgi:CelD/BcsL family acetyltransferase involved in cellulose biosynthesis